MPPTTLEVSIAAAAGAAREAVTEDLPHGMRPACRPGVGPLGERTARRRTRPWLALGVALTCGCQAVATAPRLDPTERITVVGDSVEADSIPTVPDLYAITLARSDTALVLSFWMADPPGALGTAWLAGLDLDTDRDATTPPGALWEFEDGTRVGPDFRALPAGPGAAPGVQGTWSLEHTYAGDWTTVPSRVAPGRRHLLTIPRQAVLDTGSDWPFVLALYQGPGPGWTLAQAWVGAPDGAPARRVYPYYGPGGFALRARSPLVRRPLLPGERPILTSL